jgi:hypothetical protein
MLIYEIEHYLHPNNGLSSNPLAFRLACEHRIQDLMPEIRNLLQGGQPWGCGVGSGRDCMQEGPTGLCLCMNLSCVVVLLPLLLCSRSFLSCFPAPCSLRVGFAACSQTQRRPQTHPCGTPRNGRRERRQVTGQNRSHKQQKRNGQVERLQSSNTTPISSLPWIVRNSCIQTTVASRFLAGSDATPNRAGGS